MQSASPQPPPNHASDPDSEAQSWADANAMIGQVVDQLPVDRAQVDAAQERFQEADRQVRSFVSKNPTVTVLGAVAVGFLVGRMVTR